MSPTLASIVAQHPYPDFQKWWPLGEPFLAMMADAILGQWRPLAPSSDDLAAVQRIVDEYITLVYKREARPRLAANFAAATDLNTVQSGEFDALSYGFFRSAYGSLASHHSGDELATARREFAERVGAHFFAQLSDLLALDLPRALLNESDFTSVASAIEHIGGFLQQQGYLRSHFAFRFDVTTTRADGAIDQKPGDVIQALGNGGTAYALYEMGHPVILPSAVYLYRTVGEAQHHSSRTIEELFARVGCDAWETDDFDPTNYPSDLVVELWQIRRRPLID